MSHFTCYESHVTCHMSWVTCHLSSAIGHLSPIDYHLSPTPTATATDSLQANSPTMHIRLICQYKTHKKHQYIQQKKIILSFATLAICS